LFQATDGLFDPTSGPLIALWRRCRSEQRVPSEDEIQAVLLQVGGQNIKLAGSAARLCNDVKVNLGAIGKGFALDEAAETMLAHDANCWLLHGGRSSMIASGSNIQYFRHRGKRYGHILDPKTGWPANQVASVTILAPTAAEADALSTAFFVGGVEFARIYCDNHPQISAILIPFPESGTTIRPVLVNMPADRVMWNKEQVDLT
jgi:thiamine biosynthesis lipoprotein